MRSRNPLFRRFSRLNECQIVALALSELEQNIRKPTKHSTALMRRVGYAMQQKFHQIKAAPEICQTIIRRALCQDPREGYSCLTDMIIDLHRARSQMEGEKEQRVRKEQQIREEKEQKRIQKPTFSDRALRPLVLSFSILIGIGLAAGVGVAIHYLYPNGVFLTSVEVPSLVGQNLKSITPDSDLFALDLNYQFDSRTEVGTILSQSPQAGMTRQVSPGRHPCTLTLMVSLGPEQVQIGDYAGMTKHQAMAECRRLGLIPTVKSVSHHPAGNVARSEPAAGTVVSRGTSVTLYVGTQQHMAQVSVPNLIDNSEVGAKTMLSSLGLICGNVSYMTSDRPAGTVIAQSILSGTPVKTGTRVSIVVSNGKG